MEHYYIKDGVRRAIAMRELGRVDIAAVIEEHAKPDRLTRVRLDPLHSPKMRVLRDYRYVRYTEYPTVVLRSEPPPITVERLGGPGQSTSTPLLKVTLK